MRRVFQDSGLELKVGVYCLVLRFSFQGTRFYFGVKVPFLQAGFWLGIEVPVLGV